MAKVIQVLFSELEERLRGLNYVVSLGVYPVPAAEGTSRRQCISAALGPQAVVRAVYFPPVEEVVKG